ncbi:MAG: mannose-1-phosphate guanylyltransferase/mannose-6-phosphate isomerase [Lentisphaerales bacterium]|nr:mannose-1-phosphate guanylyltransferase/mannose-6-phosphate isomerase [Lentisphaerales bacterium]
MIQPVIMAGGIGSRLWPLSRELYPKQFLALVTENTMIQDTALRLEGVESLKCPLVICNEEHRFLVAEQMRQISCELDSIILEPAGRNTAPAIALAALRAVEQGDDPVLLVLAADHMISDVKEFQTVVTSAIPNAVDGKMVTFGIVADQPETGYGYIQQGKELKSGAFEVAAFKEKPAVELAQKYLAEGRYLWNSGMFMFKASVYLKELEKFEPEIFAKISKAYESKVQDNDFLRVGEQDFLACPSNSIDYAVMEKTSSAVVVPMDAGWSDVGSWSSLWNVSDKDSSGNVIRGDVLPLDSDGNLIIADKRQICTLGVSDLVIVETNTSVLVANKMLVENVKEIVNQLKAKGRQEVELHRQVCRPWGKYDSIDAGERFQVKHITVKPGGKLSVQKHFHRAEHWIVVSGTAKVLNGEHEIILTENQSTYIPIGEVHALENPGKIPLELIEVQSGSYLGEDDIIRYEDRYGRS